MRVEITRRPVGSFFGGKWGRTPGLLMKTTPAGGQRISHGFELKLNAHSEPEVVWDTPCAIPAPPKEKAEKK